MSQILFLVEKKSGVCWNTWQKRVILFALNDAEFIGLRLYVLIFSAV